MEKPIKIKKGVIVKFNESDDVCVVTYVRYATPDDEKEGFHGEILGVVNSKRNFTFNGYRTDQEIPMFGEVTTKHATAMRCKHCKNNWKCFKYGLFHGSHAACEDFLCNFKKFDHKPIKIG